MILEKIELLNFRNFENFVYLPNENINIIVGDNGIGKTNLVEAIYYLNTAKGFKNKKDDELLRNGSNEFVIKAKINNNDITYYFNKETNEKHIFVNSKKISKLSDLSKYINILLFEPGFANIFKDSPKRRRNYLDLSIAKVSDKYYQKLKEYLKLLKERNLILKNRKIEENLLRAIDIQLVTCSKIIDTYRYNYIKSINKVLNEVSKKISNKNKLLFIEFNPLCEINDEYENNLFNKYKELRKKDILTKTTTIGIHKEDFLMKIENQNISIYGSQAENRLASISMILSSCLILKSEDKPIIILDDVLSELDEENQDRLLSTLKEFKQVFITANKTKYIDYEFDLKEELNQ